MLVHKLLCSTAKVEGRLSTWINKRWAPFTYERETITVTDIKGYLSRFHEELRRFHFPVSQPKFVNDGDAETSDLASRKVGFSQLGVFDSRTKKTIKVRTPKL